MGTEREKYGLRYDFAARGRSNHLGTRNIRENLSPREAGKLNVHFVMLRVGLLIRDIFEKSFLEIGEDVEMNDHYM